MAITQINNEMTLEVSYKTKRKINNSLDHKIRKFFKSLGFEWWAEGFNLNSRKRDICFKKIDK